MNPVIKYLLENNTSIRFDMSTPTDDFDWYLHDVSDDGTTYDHLPEFNGPIKRLLISIAEDIETIFHIWGLLHIEDGKLNVEFDYEISQLRNDSKTYKL
jgi:hypothetical protein